MEKIACRGALSFLPFTKYYSGGQIKIWDGRGM